MMKLEIAVVQCDALIFQHEDEIQVVTRVRIIGVIELEYIDEINGYMALWNAVLLQALQDARGNTYLPGSDKGGKKSAMLEAKHWLTEDKKDFYAVCDLCGRSPKYTRQLAMNALENNVQWRAAPGQGDRFEYKKKKNLEYAMRRRKRNLSRGMAHYATDVAAGGF